MEYKGKSAMEPIRRELILDAADANLPALQAFVEETLELVSCPMKILMQISVAVEEIFINIAHYAYAPKTGKAEIVLQIEGNPPEMSLTFRDKGIPYDPVAKKDPDLSVPAAEREVGGLGIFMAKQFVDELQYEYREGQNVLTMKKRLAS